MTPNTALRAALRLPSAVPGFPSPTTAGPNPGWHRRGKLAALLDAGLLHEGTVLTWRRPRLRDTHTATVTAHGYLLTSDGRQHLSPDSCASVLAGHPCKGWKGWRTSDGTTLHDLSNLLLSQDARTDGTDQEAVEAVAADGDR